MTQGRAKPGDRIPVAMLVNAPSPYRFAVNARVAREIPEIELITAFLWDRNIQAWGGWDMASIGGVQYGPGEGVKARLGWRDAWHEWRKGGRIARDLQRRGVRAVVSSGYAIPAMIRVLMWAWSSGIPTYIWSDSNSAGDRASGLKRIVKRIYVGSIVRRLTGVLPSGTRGCGFYEPYGATHDKMFFFPLEPEVDLMLSQPEEYVAQVSRKHGLGADRKRLVVSGRLAPEKAVDVAIRAFAGIARERPEWDLILAGDGDLEGELRAIVPPDLRERVRFLGFIAEQQELAAIYHASHVLFHPARRDAWAVVIEEAIVCGMAVASSTVPGAVADQVLDGVNGVIFPPDDVPAASAALLRVTESGTLERMRANSPKVLGSWRGVFDPVRGLRAALHAGGLPVDPQGGGSAEALREAIGRHLRAEFPHA